MNEICENCCDSIQTEKAKLCQKSYLAGIKHYKNKLETAKCEILNSGRKFDFYNYDMIETNKVIDIIDKTFEKSENDDWIPIKNGYPKFVGKYLISDIYEQVHLVDLLFDLTTKEPYFSGSYIVKAWMPSPEPFRY